MKVDNGITKTFFLRTRKSRMGIHFYYTYLQEAHIIAGKLRVHEIESMIQTVPGASALGLTLGNWGEINVLVEPTIYDAAYDILFPTDENQLGDYADTDDNMWHDDGDGDEYYIDDEEGDDE